MFLQEVAPISIPMEQNKILQSVIYFYDQNDPQTYWLGNFYPIKVEYNGLVFADSEAAFQAQKFINYPQIMAEFTNLTGDQAYHKARELESLIRPDWSQVKVEVMKEVLLAKVHQNPIIASKLEATGDAALVEHNPVKGRDAFWSDDHDGTGLNMLGKLWMEIRSELQSNQGL